MKIELNTKELGSALTVASVAIARPAVIPATNYVKVTANKEKQALYLEGTSAESNVITVVRNIGVETDDVFLLDPKFLIDAMKKTDASTIVISRDDASPLIQLKLGKAKFAVNGMRPTDFPKYGTVGNEGVVFEMSVEDLEDIAKNVGYAVSHKDHRPVLCGVNISSDGSQVNCCATDSFRLGRKTYDNIKVPEFRVTVPQKALENALSIFKGKEKVKVRVTPKKISFAGEDTVFTSSLLEGAFPDVDRLIPDSSSAYATRIKVNRAELLGMVDRSTLFYSVTEMPNIRFNIENDSVDIFCENAELGNYDERLESCVIEGDNNIHFAVDPTYMRDALKSIHEENVWLNVVGDLKPIIIEGEKEGNKHIALVLPMRTYN